MDKAPKEPQRHSKRLFNSQSDDAIIQSKKKFINRKRARPFELVGNDKTKEITKQIEDEMAEIKAHQLRIEAHIKEIELQKEIKQRREAHGN